MKILLPLLMLAGAPAAALDSVPGRVVAAPEVSEARTEQIELFYTRAAVVRQRCRNAIDALRARSGPERAELLSRVAATMEDPLRERLDKILDLRRSLAAKRDAGDISTEEFQARDRALSKAADLGTLFVYGGALPRLLEDMEPGAGFSPFISEEEYQALERRYKREAGVGDGAY